MGVFEIFQCCPCFGRKAPLLQNARPSTDDLPSKSRQSTVDFSDSEPETTKLQNALRIAQGETKSAPPYPTKSNRALTVSAKHTYVLVEEHPFPSLETDEDIIISTRAVGLNPIDWKSVDYNFCLPAFPWVTGREMAGIVEAVGPNVQDFKVGDKVWTSTYYRDSRAGCFQQYVAVPQHTVCHIPSNLTFESASCLGVAGLTAAMTLWRWLQVPRTHAELHPTDPIPHPPYLLIWGGSSVTAQFATQLAARSGVKVIAVASTKTKALVESLGATSVIVRNGKSGDEIVAEIREIAGNDITRAIDLVGTETAQYCLNALSTEKDCIFAPLAMISSEAIVPNNIKVETVEMKQFVLDPASRVHALELGNLIEEGRVKLPSIEVLEGGLDSVQMGLERLKKGDMEGRKLVVSF